MFRIIGYATIYLLLLLVSCFEVIAQDDCGIYPDGLFLADRIVGGTGTEDGEVPWLVSISFQGQHKCGGSLISSKYVLTAAHCVDRSKPNELRLVMGIDNLVNSSFHKQEYSIEKIILHQSFRRGVGRKVTVNDIALLKIAEEVKLSEHLWYICLPSDELDKLEGTKATVSGFGAKRLSGELSDILLKVTIPVHNNSICKEIYSGKGIISSHLCAGALSGGLDACQGDSGGPLYYSKVGKKPKWTLIGIVSEGEGCGWEGKLGIYTRVSSYLQWIKQNRDDLEVKKIPNFVNVLFGQNNDTSNPPEKKVSVIEVPNLTTSSVLDKWKLPTCILCICEGATKNCTKESDIQRRQGFYGMFAMQKEYWLDGGKLRLREDDKLSPDAAFRRCATDVECSSNTVKTYLRKYKKDCNFDGNIDCDDYARLHYHGPTGCSSPNRQHRQYWKAYTACKNQILGNI
ncbi:transmembrane protease serine 11D-like isoform X1 [Artemia franciscana]|uniref:lysozyme n=2 Tax=Artemia franciscana TaxID=6661 RepID=A0AA88HS30_ARTSF|nr:hypothetical protein QYM36_010591 [Artemia franciscana]